MFYRGFLMGRNKSAYYSQDKRYWTVVQGLSKD